MDRRLSHRDVVRELAAAADPQRAANLVWFFKTGKGQYGEGDRFIGITVPVQRKIAMRYRDLALSGVKQLLASRIHEYRLVALEILVAQYERADEEQRKRIVAFYLEHTDRINNWDLVDGSAPYILGHFLLNRSRKILDRLAGSANLWERRIAIVATFAFIRNGEIEDTYRIAEKLLGDQHDLIWKAVGWALRETGKVSRPALLAFLGKHYGRMPRTTLRYAIERFTPEERKQMLAGRMPAV